MIVRISKGSYPASRHAEFTARMVDAGKTLIPAIRKLPGCLSYFAATDENSSTMVNVSVWDTLEHAQAMASLPEMVALGKEFIALGAEFERPIVNYPALWHLP
jgi:quinol monooxygenase YgiN